MRDLTGWTIHPPRWRRNWDYCSDQAMRHNVPFYDDKPPHDVALVTHWCPRDRRKAVVELARCFRREFGYDFVQFSEVNDGHSRDEAIVWIDSSYAMGDFAVGALSFRWREYTNGTPHAFALQWAWLHPYARHRGRLHTLWPWLRRRYGSFHVERPLSAEMASFLASVAEAPHA